MSKPLVMAPNIERIVVDYLKDNLHEATVTVAIGVPDNFRPTATGTHLQIDSFVPFNIHPIAYFATIRLIAHAKAPTEAQRVAAKAAGVLAAHEGGNGITQVRMLTGPNAAVDPVTHTELAAVELRVTFRAIQI